MTTASASAHSLVVYTPSARADAALRRVCHAAHEQGGRVTVLAVATQERPSSRCCDTRSVLWNRICREMAREDLTRAALVAGDDPGIGFGVLIAPAGRTVQALVAEALTRAADELVLADPRAAGLGRLGRRRLRRTSTVPVSAA